jgi:AcrR family transcriptional regulator
MPTPARTSRDEIVAAARAIADADRLEAVTMERVAAAVGVRAPSLYKRVRDRSELIHLVANAAAADLGDLVEKAARTGDPRRDLRRMVDTMRAFAREKPSSYGLVFDRQPDGWGPDQSLLEHGVEPLLRTAAELAGPDRALEAARTTMAWARGFIEMEITGAFTLGGDVEAAYEFGIDRITDAFETRRARRQDRP